ncbi:MAG: hypothetical protein ACI3VK_07265 [Oscillospiraceae bacterium]
MTHETKTMCKHIIREHPKVEQIIRKTLAAAVEADASAEEAMTACRLAERLIAESTPSPPVSEFADEAIAALDTLKEFPAASFDSGSGIGDKPGSENG